MWSTGLKLKTKTAAQHLSRLKEEKKTTPTNKHHSNSWVINYAISREDCNCAFELPFANCTSHFFAVLCSCRYSQASQCLKLPQKGFPLWRDPILLIDSWTREDEEGIKLLKGVVSIAGGIWDACQAKNIVWFFSKFTCLDSLLPV